MTDIKKVCVVGASGKLGQFMVQHALDQGYEVVGVCRMPDPLGACAQSGKIAFEQIFPVMKCV